jgi:hypothetical protein
MGKSGGGTTRSELHASALFQGRGVPPVMGDRTRAIRQARDARLVCGRMPQGETGRGPQ